MSNVTAPLAFCFINQPQRHETHPQAGSLTVCGSLDPLEIVTTNKGREIYTLQNVYYSRRGIISKLRRCY
jgi:hypothetical protein